MASPSGTFLGASCFGLPLLFFSFDTSFPILTRFTGASEAQCLFSPQNTPAKSYWQPGQQCFSLSSMNNLHTIRKLAYQLISKRRPGNCEIYISFFVNNDCLKRKKKNKRDIAYFSCAKPKEKSSNERKRRKI